MATSPNYGWSEPDNSSLVKNGAADIRTLGDAIDTFLFRPFNKNSAINGAMEIWQRGTSFASSASVPVMTADRWMYQGLATGRTMSRQTTGIEDIQYCLRVARDSGNANTTSLSIRQNYETINSIPYAGKSVTLSFYARAGANYSAASLGLVAQLKSGTGVDQQSNVYTGSVNVISQTATLTTSWQRFTYTATVPTNSTEISPVFIFIPTGTAGANDYFEITGIQLEAGSQATPFSRTAGSIQGELAACQRYYYRATFDNLTNRLGVGFATSTANGQVAFPFGVAMRTRPTALEQSGTAGDYSLSVASGSAVCNAVPTIFVANTNGAVVNFPVASGLTAGESLMFRNVNTNAYLGWSAEL